METYLYPLWGTSNSSLDMFMIFWIKVGILSFFVFSSIGLSVSQGLRHQQWIPAIKESKSLFLILVWADWLFDWRSGVHWVHCLVTLDCIKLFFIIFGLFRFQHAIWSVSAIQLNLQVIKSDQVSTKWTFGNLVICTNKKKRHTQQQKQSLSYKTSCK